MDKISSLWQKDGRNFLTSQELAELINALNDDLNGDPNDNNGNNDNNNGNGQ